MKIMKTGHRILFLTFVFIAAFVFNIYVSQKQNDTPEDGGSSAMTACTLPVIEASITDAPGDRLNAMHGYTGGVSSDVTADTLMLLPSDRRLALHIRDNGSYVSGFTYEIRAIDTSDLIENTTISELVRSSNGIDVVLPIQNLIIQGKEYSLDITLTVEDVGDVHYYSRLMLPEEQQTAQDMLQLARDFSSRNFDYETARANTTYVETDGSADDTTLAYTTLKSTFKNLAYSGLKLVPSDDRDVRLVHYDGNSGEIFIRTLASGTGDDEEVYEIEESFSMRMGIERIYMMNYSRRIREVFTVSESNLTGRRLTIGINDETELAYLSGGEGRYVYFVVTRDLWCYDTQIGEIRRVWSFRDRDLLDADTSYPKNAVSMLKVDGTGGITFLVYGYMTRGIHEGKVGIGVMHYDTSENTVTERFFIPVSETYEKLDLDMKTLAHLGNNNVLYLKIGDAVYGIDMTSESMIEVVPDVREDTYFVSSDKEQLAWQAETDAFGTEVINILDLDTGAKREIKADEGTLLRPCGFIGRDLAVAICSPDDEWELNGVVRSIPAMALEISDDEQNVVKHYEKEGQYISDIEISDGRISITLVKRAGEKAFTAAGEDTIVSSILPPARSQGIGSYVSEDRGRIFYVQMEESMGKSGSSVQMTTDFTSTGITPMMTGDIHSGYYDAYAEGKMIGSYENLSDAIEAAYPRMGAVRRNGKLIYNRAGTVSSRIIADVQYQADSILKARENGSMQSLFGLSLRPALYYVGIKCPLLVYDDRSRPLLIYAYDKTEISIYDIEEDRKYRQSIDEAAAAFEAAYNDFGYVP